MGATDSLTELYASIRAHLISYTDGGAAPNTIQAATSGRVYNEAPPDPAAGAQQAVPFVILTIDGNPPDESMDPTRIEFQVEAQVIHRPRTGIATARRIADLAWKALATYRIPGPDTGFIRLRVPTMPETLPRPSSDADRDVVQIIVTADGFAYWNALATAFA